MRVLLLFVALAAQSSGRPAEDDSVVSVYTTQATTAGEGLDVYHQIATNLAERITSPIFRFLGFNRNKTDTSTRKSWSKIELLDEEEVTKATDLINNEIDDRDVEEVSIDSLKKVMNSLNKPEKFSFNYLPANLEANDTMNEIPDDINGDDDEPFEFNDNDTARGGNPLIYVIEWFASLWQLLSGAFEAIFGSSGSYTSS